MILRADSSNPPTEASSLSGLLPKGSSPSPRRKDNNESRLVKTSKQINISYENGVFKASIQGDVTETLQVLQDRRVLKAYATNYMIFTPQEQEMFS